MRKAVRCYLVERIGTALSAASILRGINREWDSDAKEVKDALHFLVNTDPKQVSSSVDNDGSTIYYSISAAGVLAHERSS